MSIRRAPRPDSEFLLVRNDVVRDTRLSYRARGLLVAILSRPDNWRTDSTQLAREAKEGRDAVRAALNELKLAGYLIQTKRRDEKGHWVTETVIFDTPQGKTAGQTGDGISGVGGSGVGDSGTIGTTDTNDLHEDVLECPDSPSSSRARDEFTDWRQEDQELFRSIVGADISTDGSRWKPKGVHAADAFYDAFRKNKGKPIDWPGRFLAQIEERGGGGVDDYLAAQGLDREAMR